VVHDDPIAVLERELVRAARRMGAGEETVSLPGARRAPGRGDGTHGRRAVPPRSAGTIAVLLSTAAVIAVVLGAVVALGGHQRPRRPTPAPAAAASTSGAGQLVEILGVLRRPQTAADRSSALGSRFSNGLLGLAGTPDLALMRYATTTPWGERLYVVPMNPPTTRQIKSFALRFPGARGQLARLARPRAETLMVFSAGGFGGAGDAATIERGGGIGTEGAGRSFAGGSTATRITVVVPDGVAKVQFVFPRQPSPGQPGAPIYSHSLSVVAPVTDNIAAVQVDREVTIAQFPMIWYGPSGQVVKRIGDLAAANRVTRSPKPGPQTPLSLAAERNPSTPNRVWVTPSVGSPDTLFMLHFEVLLNDADYAYRLSGTLCPGLTVQGGDGGGANDLRGRIWSDVVDAVGGQSWCPGTYHLSATIMDRGRYGPLKHPASPFGTATFTVKP
jgi:hypothetical protein